MAWKWVAPASAAAKAVITGRVKILTARNLAQKNGEHTERIGDLERHQERTAEAYVLLIEMVESMGLWVDRVLEGEVDGVAVEHSRDEILSIRSFVKAAGSLEVNECFDELLAHCARISDIASRRCDLEARVVGDEEESGQNSDLNQTLGALVSELAMARKTKLNLVDLVAEDRVLESDRQELG